jgi:acyl dehydratase
MAARTRALNNSPGALGLYARAAAPLLPGASRLPFVAGGGGEIPDLELTLAGVRVDPARLDAYRRVCGFSPSQPERLPATYPHVLAFPLHLALMTDGSFPFGAIGLVHTANRIVQHRALRPAEPLDLRVRATPLQDHPRGRTFSLVSEARVGNELVWEGLSTMLRRGGGTHGGGRGGDRDGSGNPTGVDTSPDTGTGAGTAGAPPSDAEKPPEPAPLSAEWRLPDSLGRDYAAVSGDRNPIHLHALTAKPLGFPRAIAHGMWTKARSLAALERELPDAYAVEVRFRRPISLPATVGFWSEGEDSAAIRFGVRDATRTDTRHLDGRIEPLPSGTAPPPSTPSTATTPPNKPNKEGSTQ